MRLHPGHPGPRRLGADGSIPVPARRRAVLRLLAWAAPGLAAGCAGSLLPQAPAAAARFTLDGATPRPAAPEPAAGAPALVVAVPTAAPGFGGTGIVFVRRAHELETFAFHEWVDSPARMLAPLLVRALQDSGAFRAVLLAPSTASGTLRLETELIRLQHEFVSRPSQVRLTLRAVLLDTASRQVLAWREFDESVQAPTDDPLGGIAAAHQVTQRVLVALAAFGAESSRR